MKYSDLVEMFRDRPYFETEDTVILGGVSRDHAFSILPRWVRQDKLVQIRRGSYLLPESVRRKPASPFFISNQLYSPSYVSLHSALQFHSLIPEAVHRVDAVTSRQTRRFESAAGMFEYHSIRTDRFWGYTRQTHGPETAPPQGRFFIAHPEKAILDLMYLHKGEWTLNRIRELRLQNLQRINGDRLQSFATRFGSPRINRAVQRLLMWYQDEMVVGAPT